MQREIELAFSAYTMLEGPNLARFIAKQPTWVRRTMSNLGKPGVQLGLWDIAGVAYVRATLDGDACTMHKGEALVEVWGGDADKVLESARRSSDPADRIVVVHRPSTRVARLRSWLRWIGVAQ